MNSDETVMVALIVGGIAAGIFVFFRAIASGAAKRAFDLLFSRLGLTAIAWALLGSSLGCLVTILAAGVNGEPRLLAGIVSNPRYFLVWPALLGAIAGFSLFIIRQR